MTGTWIPDEVMKMGDEKGLTLRQIILYSRILSLDNDKGCFATNAWFAEKINCDRSMITKMVKVLKEKGLISVQTTQKGMKKERVIRVVNGFTTVVNTGNNVVNPCTTDGEPITHREYSLENKKNTCVAPARKISLSDPVGSNDFETFCKTWKVKFNRPLQDAWREAGHEEHATILDHSVRYLKSLPPSFRPNPLKYLKNFTWLNDPTPERRNEPQSQAPAPQNLTYLPSSGPGFRS